MILLLNVLGVLGPLKYGSFQEKEGSLGEVKMTINEKQTSPHPVYLLIVHECICVYLIFIFLLFQMHIVELKLRSFIASRFSDECMPF